MGYFLFNFLAFRQGGHRLVSPSMSSRLNMPLSTAELPHPLLPKIISNDSGSGPRNFDTQLPKTSLVLANKIKQVIWHDASRSQWQEYALKDCR